MDLLKESLIIIPAYNEELSIGETLKSLSKVFTNILVVDDASTDKTVEIAKLYTQNIISHLYNVGQGGAIQTAIDFFQTKTNYKYLITFDADGQHQTEDAYNLLKECDKKNYDLVIGSRFLSKKSIENIPKTKRQILKLAAIFESKLSNLKMTDAHVGLRVLSKKMCSLTKLQNFRMAHSTEILLIASRNNLTVKEEPVFIKYNEYGQNILNSFNIILDLCFFLLSDKK